MCGCVLQTFRSDWHDKYCSAADAAAAAVTGNSRRLAEQPAPAATAESDSIATDMDATGSPPATQPAEPAESAEPLPPPPPPPPLLAESPVIQQDIAEVAREEGETVSVFRSELEKLSNKDLRLRAKSVRIRLRVELHLSSLSGVSGVFRCWGGAGGGGAGGLGEGAREGRPAQGPRRPGGGAGG